MEGDGESWNVRDTHMTETLERLVNLHGEPSKRQGARGAGSRRLGSVWTWA